MKDFCIGISCVENLDGDINYYTSLTLKFIERWKKHGDVFVYTNNVDVFKDKEVNIIPFDGEILTVENGLKLNEDEKNELNLNQIYSTHDKMNIVNYVFNLGYNGCLIVDADEEITMNSDSVIETFKNKISTLNKGFHFLGYWDSFYETQDSVYFYPEWGHLKKYEYFYRLKESLEFDLNNKTKPVRESNFFVKKFDEWDLFFKQAQKYRNIAIKNDLTKFEWEDKKPYRPLGTGEGLSWVVTINELGLQKYFNINDDMVELDMSIIRHYHPLNDVT